MFGRKKENDEEKVGILTRLKNFFTGKKESAPEVFEMNDLEPAPEENTNQPDIETYSRYTEEYQNFLASQDQQLAERAIPTDTASENTGAPSGDTVTEPKTNSETEMAQEK